MNPVNGVFKLFYWPICRAYARYLGDRPADAMLRILCLPQFWRVNRFWPNFLQPNRFTEKLWSFQLHNRSPKLTMVMDKLCVRDYVAEKVGSEYLIPLLWSGEKPEEIPYDDLPHNFVIKANHGCDFNIIVNDKMELERKKVETRLNKWLGINFGQDTYLGIAWGYKNIKPTIIIESFIGENFKAPADYKFYCFNGKVDLLTLHFDRFEDHKTRSFDRNFEPREFRYDFESWNGECQKPSNFEEMVRVAESLAEGFDFMRVDLYSTENRIYFGELTPYPGGVATKFLPTSEDDHLGEKWKWS